MRFRVRRKGGGAAFGVYVHWPYCVAKCPYCDFNSHTRRAFEEDDYVAAIRSELRWFADQTSGRPADTLFFGGGTPSLMRPAAVAAIIEEVDQLWGFAAAPEITLEANPSSVEAERFRGYQAAGVNRLSLGVQALDDPSLKALGRVHDAGAALAALKLAAQIFPRYSFDLIYARPGQSAADWRAELTRGLELAGDHLSLYQLTMEPGTQFHALWRRGELVLPDEATALAQLDAARELCEAAGLPAYEVSNHARVGYESRHNLIYWRYHDYIGVGPGAHGRLRGEAGRQAFQMRRSPGKWLEAVRREGAGVEAVEPLTGRQQALEMLLMGMRLREGVSLSRLGRETGFAPDQSTLQLLQEQELVTLAAESNRRLAATDRGERVLNAVIEQLASALRRVDDAKR